MGTGDLSLNPESGVTYFNNRKETYYSSKVLYHKDTEQWVVDSEGMYRTSDGFYVIASSDYPKGTILEVSKGLGEVLDCGCDSGIIDYYCNW